MTTGSDPTAEGMASGPRTAAAIRAEFEALVAGDLLGPAQGEEEQLDGRGKARDRYLVGMLAPRGTVAVDAARADELGVDGDDAPEGSDRDDAENAAPKLFASSVGLTATVPDVVTELRVTAAWGRYLKTTVERETEGGIESQRVWKRQQVSGSIAIPLAEGLFGPESPVAEQPEVIVRGRITHADGHRMVTVFLVNDQQTPKQNKDEAWLFQVKLGLEALDGSAVFVGRSEAIPDQFVPEGEAGEVAQLDMLYRNRVEFAVGHATAVHAYVDPDNPARARRIESVSMPGFEVPRTEAPRLDDASALSEQVWAALGSVEFDMSVLSELEGSDLVDRLTPLVTGYRKWLDEQRASLDDPGARLGGHRDAAEHALSEAAAAADRLEAGIGVLASSAEAGEAFRFANRAMWQQRVHTLAAAERKGESELKLPEAVARVDVPANRSWRPFQLAFLLLNLPALTDPTHPERREHPDGLVDLLFFPTGGGKTEAYLGLTAYTLAIRRLQGMVEGYDGSGGMAVMMRYTLRLLTAQQFQRAAALMCAAELIRRERVDAGDERWGDTPFRLGMWVGSGVTPNRSAEAQGAVESARTGGPGRSGRASPLQLTSCPWCGSKLDLAKDVTTKPVELWRTFVYCSDEFGDCPFTAAGSWDAAKNYAEGIPVLTVDEEIYRLLPAFLISTADKWAQLPWQGPLQLLFGRVERRCERHGYRSPDLDKVGQREERDRHNKTADLPAATTVPVSPLRPPDLIIQDELHLISGPLGTLVGLYETAIDKLASWEVNGQTVRPKLVASTATVRRAAEQVHALFWRRLAVFPPAVLDIEDSFFAQQVQVTDEDPGRRYLGICAHGHRLKAVEVRVYLSVLAAAQRLYERYGALADPYMTLVGYFGSLRELGGMVRLVNDDVRVRLRKSDQRGLSRRAGLVVRELTSRISSQDIPQVLDQLGVKHDPDRPEDGPVPIDVLLATSMISVGVDVGRLGLMVVVGQPKTTAEYIQATSRVGRERSGPGLVLTIYNWARPRDLSHYERFEHYHATFYRHVEALSVTPFAPRALDRGLTALLVALVRQGDHAWNGNLKAKDVDTNASIVDEVVAAVAKRAAAVHARADLEQQVRDQLEFRLDSWAKRQGKAGVILGYKEERGAVVGLLEFPGIRDWNEWTAPNSLRETEPTVNLIIDPWDGSMDQPATYQLGDGERRDLPETVVSEDDSIDEEEPS